MCRYGFTVYRRIARRPTVDPPELRWHAGKSCRNFDTRQLQTSSRATIWLFPVSQRSPAARSEWCLRTTPEVSRKLQTVLVVDDDTRFLGRLQDWLVTRNYRVVCTHSGAAAMAKAAVTVVDVALVDYRLRGLESGLDLAHRLRASHGIPFVLVSGFLNTAVIVKAMRLGASDVLDKPLSCQRLLNALDRALAPALDEAMTAAQNTPEVESWQSEESVSRRWAQLVLRGCESKRDPKTVLLFARAALVSSSVFRTISRLCDVRPRDACDLGRVLRAASLSHADRSPLAAHLSVGDERTLARLLDRAGLTVNCRSVELRELLCRQHFVDADHECLRELGHLAANSSLFTFLE